MCASKTRVVNKILRVSNYTSLDVIITVQFYLRNQVTDI